MTQSVRAFTTQKLSCRIRGCSGKLEEVEASAWHDEAAAGATIYQCNRCGSKIQHRPSRL